ncbi:MAG: GNAT family protein [Pseudomonadota bacterium]
MAFLRTVTPSEAGPVVYGDGIHLRVPQASDFPAWSALRADSRAFLTPWEPTWPRDDLTRSAFKRRLRRYQRDIREDHAYPFFLHRSEDDALIGGATLSNIRRGVAQACSLGYWMGERYAGQRYMSRAVRALIPFVFDTLRLHRLEAACLPNNDSSIQLLERCGFQREGYARQYLCINGIWQDHILYALLKGDMGR